jgi:aminoglycoside phosphotransferase (APT) family kinase protein
VERLAGVRLALPEPDVLQALLERQTAASCVLHMDMRPANLLTWRSEIKAVVDWTNALTGDPALELARIAEYGHLTDEFRAGYGAAAAVPKPVELLYRLDTAVMLAVVFLSEAPNAELGARQVARTVQLTHYLVG